MSTQQYILIFYCIFPHMWCRKLKAISLDLYGGNGNEGPSGTFHHIFEVKILVGTESLEKIIL